MLATEGEPVAAVWNVYWYTVNRLELGADKEDLSTKRMLKTFQGVLEPIGARPEMT